MMIQVKMTKSEIQEAVADFIQHKWGFRAPPCDVRILVKSKQNFKSEWEDADFKADFLATPKGRDE